MRNASWLWIALVIGCKGETSPGEDEAPVDDVTEDTDSGTTPDLGCYSDWAMDFEDDGEVEGTGIDVYDSVRTELLLHFERDYGSGARASGDYAYDADGNVLLIEYDNGDDGTVDSITSYTYDDAGNLVGFALDIDGDGMANYAAVYAWDEEGRRVSTIEDWNGDGLNDRWYTYVYDTVGRLIEVAADDGNNGTIEYLATTTYTDPLLVTGSTVIDEENDGVVDQIDTFESDASGRIVHREQDVLADGYPDLIGSFVYDAATGVLVEREEERHDPPPNQDNIYWDRTEYQYDELLRLVDQYEDDEEIAEGVASDIVVVRQTWTFAGTCP